MLRSMFTAISSLNLHQEYLDVVASNLANANTVGYKASRVLFQDQFAQLLSPGSAPTTARGGVNPTQVGLGVQMGYITPNFTQGMMQNTGRNLDLAIQGDGFFIYNNGTERLYSREGSLSFDSSGYLVNTASGLRIQGWMADTSGAIDTNLPVGDISVATDHTIARATQSAVIDGNLNSDTAVGGTISTTMGVYDSLGDLHTVTVNFTRTSATDWSWQIDPADGAGGGTMTFGADGQMTGMTTATAINIPVTGGASNINMTLDLNDLTMLSTETSAAISSQDGLPPGTVSDIYVTPGDGSIYLIYTNGMRETVGQLAMARFSNPEGLIRSGSSSYEQGLNSGEPEIGVANTGGRGAIACSYLEASNVDMAQEFTNMILAQRGFQASSRVITTSDEILQELVNLKR
jgi:flagellar hook protein FlgE